MEYGNRIKEIRNSFGESQKKFGERFNITSVQISLLESEQRDIKIDFISKLESFGINIEWLITGEGEMFRGQEESSSNNIIQKKVSDEDKVQPIDSLKKFRKQKGYTQEEFANKLGISRNYYSEIETGKASLPNKIKIALGGVGCYISERSEEGIVSIPLLDISASAGLGFATLSEYPQVSLLDVPSELLDIPLYELQGCHAIKVRGNSMIPMLENGDRVIVKEIKEVPSYLEGLCIVLYDSELYVKNIQLSNNKLVMKSLNKEFEDIVISNLKELDIHLQIIAKVLTVIRNIQ